MELQDEQFGELEDKGSRVGNGAGFAGEKWESMGRKGK